MSQALHAAFGFCWNSTSISYDQINQAIANNPQIVRVGSFQTRKLFGRRFQQICFKQDDGSWIAFNYAGSPINQHPDFMFFNFYLRGDELWVRHTFSTFLRQGFFIRSTNDQCCDQLDREEGRQLCSHYFAKLLGYSDQKVQLPNQEIVVMPGPYDTWKAMLTTEYQRELSRLREESNRRINKIVFRSLVIPTANSNATD